MTSHDILSVNKTNYRKLFTQVMVLSSLWSMAPATTHDPCGRSRSKYGLRLRWIPANHIPDIYVNTHMFNVKIPHILCCVLFFFFVLVGGHGCTALLQVRTTCVWSLYFYSSLTPGCLIPSSSTASEYIQRYNHTPASFVYSDLKCILLNSLRMGLYGRSSI